MQITTSHDPDRYMTSLRQILTQGRKRIGLLLGAGCPTAIRIDPNGRIAPTGKPLIPDVAGLTDAVIAALDSDDQKVITALRSEFKTLSNIESILTQVRLLARAIGKTAIHGLTGADYERLGDCICKKIGQEVSAKLPKESNPYTELVSWIDGTHREHCVEVFTPNYDLLIEEAFERSHTAYFDGFSGSHKPFFDAASISSSDNFPTGWSRLWKLHGSLGWEILGETVVRTGRRESTALIYPDHLKYDQIAKMPYTALFERLRSFLTTPDSLLICAGFSFGDSHICAVLGESLKMNAHTAVLAFQYRPLEQEGAAVRLAGKHPQLSVYARNGAVISGLAGTWQPGPSSTAEWQEIRKTFWQDGSADQVPSEFLLGDFASLARFFAVAQARQMLSTTSPDEEQPADQPIARATAVGGAPC